ncbi:MAG: formylmethanofuran dehydrogenase subunit E family protein [Candidatus Freyarchaeota archaeon]|nr:formylmethanofuran dehydrogenase subunit E family protein [Candidatus Freyrarchaeum guaymaensis]
MKALERAAGDCEVAGMEEGEVEEMLKLAVRLHGHLGPFLVLGLRAGLTARKLLGGVSRVEAAVFLEPPTSCILDGLQVSSGCTVGNGRLTVTATKRREEAKATFHSDKDVLTIVFSEDFIKQLLTSLPKDKEELGEVAREVLRESEGKLFQMRHR